MSIIKIHSTGEEFSLKNEVFTVGTTEDCDVQIDMNPSEEFRLQILFDEIELSHLLNVLEASSPVLLNRIEVSEQADLSSGDEITIGGEVIYYLSKAVSTEVDHISETLESEIGGTSVEIANGTTEIISQKALPNRIGCAYCFQTINSTSQNGAVVTLDNEFYHELCLKKLQNPPQSKPIELPSPRPLPNVQLEPLVITSGVTNSLSSEPLGISESRLFLQELDPLNIRIKNNTNENLQILPKILVPWLHLEFQQNIHTHGKAILRPGENVNVTLRPHPVRATRQRYHLYFTKENYIVIYSNGADLAVWLLAAILTGIWIGLWSSFGSLAANMRVFQVLFETRPQQILYSLFQFYLQSAVAFSLLMFFIPGVMLSFTNSILMWMGHIPLINSMISRGLQSVQKWLYSEGRLSYERNNISKLIAFSISFSLIFSIPWTLLIGVILFFMTSLFSFVWLFYFFWFLFGVTMIFLFVNSYAVLGDINLSNLMSNLNSNSGKRTTPKPGGSKSKKPDIKPTGRDKSQGIECPSCGYINSKYRATCKSCRMPLD